MQSNEEKLRLWVEWSAESGRGARERTAAWLKPAMSRTEACREARRTYGKICRENRAVHRKVVKYQLRSSDGLSR